MKATITSIGVIISALLLLGATPRYIEFNVKNDSLRKQEIQIRDRQCRKALSEKCRLAKDIVRSNDCANSPSASKCKRARRVLAADGCETGTIYSGKLNPGKSVHISSCNDGSGYADIEIRVDSGHWTHYSWVDQAETIELW